MQLASLYRLTIAFAVWALTVVGTLQLRFLPIGMSHSICGPWGCGPETSALVAMHAGWLALLAPPSIYIPLRLQLGQQFVFRLGCGLATLGLVGTIAIAVWQWTLWLPQAGAWSREYIWQRCGFAIATSVDLPVLQLTAIGLLQMLWSHMRPPDNAASLSENLTPTA